MIVDRLQVASTVTDGDPFPGRNVHPLDSSQTFGPHKR